MRIADLTTTTTVADNDLIVIDNTDNSITKAITVANLKGQLGLPSRVIYANLTQSGTDAPTMTVIKNTLGYTPTFLYDNVGSYSMLFNESISASTCLVTTGGDKYPYVFGARISGGGIKIEVYNGSTKANSGILDATIKIEIYE